MKMFITPDYDHITSGIGAAMIGWVRAALAIGCAMLLLRHAEGTPRSGQNAVGKNPATV